ncbi:MAG: OmpA family protein [Lewinellaceae bacterium]|nr:OmpA family protein [Lewinellaceae bacterium]
MKFFFTIALVVVVFAAAAQPSGTLRVVLSDVQFSANKATIGPASARELDAVAALLRAAPAVTVEIGAHTDASGSGKYNLRLSQQRAQAVRSYLTKKGIAAKRLKAKGYGETQLLNRCKRGVRCSDAEMRQNRRLELRVQGLSADSSARAPWLALGGQTLAGRSVQEPTVPKMPTAPMSPGPETGSAGQAAPPAPVPRPLPRTFAGYTIEIACADKPVAPNSSLLRQFDAVFLRQAPGGPYCYYIGTFFTLPEAQQFLQEKVRLGFPNARVAGFMNDEKQYFSN